MFYVWSRLSPIGLGTDSPHEFVGAELRRCCTSLTVIVVYDESLYRDLSASIGDSATVVVGDFQCWSRGHEVS